MRKISAYKTCDGVLHETQENAKRHASKRYNDAMSNLMAALQSDCKLHSQDAYKVMEFLEYHIGSILPDLLDLKQDQQYQDIDED